MLGKIRNYKTSLLISIIILFFTILSAIAYSGNKEGYNNIFILISIAAPILIMSLSKNSIYADIGFSIFTVLIVLLYAMLLWNYMDRPPSYVTDITKVSEELRGGWFSFENPLRAGLLLGCSIASILLTSIIKLLVRKGKHLPS